MNRALLLGLLVASVWFLAGCEPQPSLFPLFREGDTFLDKQLLGNWKIWSGKTMEEAKEARLIYFMLGADGRSYNVKVPGSADDPTTMCSSARLVRLGNYLFIDFQTPELDAWPQVPYPLVHGHVFGRLLLEKDKAQIQFLNNDWVEDSIKAGKLSLAFVPLPNPVLSANTTELRQFVQQNAENAQAFSETFSLARKD